MTAVLKFLRLEGIERKKLYAIWTPLFCAVVLIVFLTPFLFHSLFDGLLGPKTTTENRTLTFLIAISAALVAWGTVTYLYEAIMTVWNIDPHKCTQKRKPSIRISILAYLLINLFTVVVAAILIWTAWSTIRNNGNFEGLCSLNEFLNLLVFLLFIVADYFFISMVRSMIEADPSNESLKKVDEMISNAFSLIDLPGFLGVFVIYVLSWAFEKKLNGDLAHSFAVGALTFHLIFTQFCVAYLRTLSQANAGGAGGSPAIAEMPTVEGPPTGEPAKT